MTSVCINTANLHSGGSLQVATSFITELTRISDSLIARDVTVVLSKELTFNLSPSVIEALETNFKVVYKDVYGLKALLPSTISFYNSFDVIFSLFGPDYLNLISSKRIVGFAQAWILYDKNEAYSLLKFPDYLKYKFKFFLQKQFFKNAYLYIVELEHVKKQMILKNIAQAKAVYVVYNCVSEVYCNIPHRDFIVERESRSFRVGLISRSYPHKNLEIIPKVRKILIESYGISVDFYVTLTEQEFSAHSKEFQQSVINLGSKKVEQCIPTYLTFDGVFFPSLLESFSATPLEALAVGRALFASDRPFNRDVCGEYAYYFDPLSAEDAAKTIKNYIVNLWGRDLEHRLKARDYALSFSNAKDRAER